MTKKQAFEALIKECILSLEGDVLLIDTYLSSKTNTALYLDRIRMKEWSMATIRILKESL